MIFCLSFLSKIRISNIYRDLSIYFQMFKTTAFIINVAAFFHLIQGMPMRCTGNTRYVPASGVGESDKGKCEVCPHCDGGGFMYDLTVSILHTMFTHYTLFAGTQFKQVINLG